MSVSQASYLNSFQRYRKLCTQYASMSFRLPVQQLALIGAVGIKQAEEDENLDPGGAPDGIIAGDHAEK